MRFQGLPDLGEPLVEALRFGVRLGDSQSPLSRELLGIALAHGRRLPDPLVHDRLRVRRLVALVVPVPAVTHEVDHHVAVELVAVHHGEPRRRKARLGIIGVHVDDRRIEALRQVARVVGRAAFAGVRREADLIVENEMDRAPGRVSREPRQVERFGHDTLSRERRVAV